MTNHGLSKALEDICFSSGGRRWRQEFLLRLEEGLSWGIPRAVQEVQRGSFGPNFGLGKVLKTRLALETRIPRVFCRCRRYLCSELGCEKTFSCPPSRFVVRIISYDSGDHIIALASKEHASSRSQLGNVQNISRFDVRQNQSVSSWNYKPSGFPPIAPMNSEVVS